MTPLRQRYIEALRLKNFSPGTIKVYVHAVEKFARHFGRSPHELGREDIRAYLVHLIEQGLARSRCVVVRNALRHLFTDTLRRPDCVEKLPRPKRERRLPVVLSREIIQEVPQLPAGEEEVQLVEALEVLVVGGLPRQRGGELLVIGVQDVVVEVLGQ